MNLESVYFYRDREKEPFDDPAQWLVANAFLHGSPEIQAGDPMKKALSVFRDRYQVK